LRAKINNAALDFIAVPARFPDGGPALQERA